MEFDLFKKIAKFPFLWKGQKYNGRKLSQNKNCLKCVSLDCLSLANSSNLEYICLLGFNNFSFRLNEGKIILNGLITKDNKTIDRGRLASKLDYYFDRGQIEDYLIELEVISNSMDTGIKSNLRDKFSLFHDVRTSYGIAFSNIEKLILKSPGTNFQEKLQNCEQGIIDLYDSLDLVNSQLDLIDVMVNPATISQGTKKYINLFKFIDKLRKLFTPKADKKNITIVILSDYQIPYGYYYDSIKLVPIILIENAIKYSDSNSKIFISFSGVSNEEKTVFSISSTGKLVPQAERENIFDKYIRGSNTKFYTDDGIGMGLYIARSILFEHNGSISYSADEKANGIGYNKFTVVL